MTLSSRKSMRKRGDMRIEPPGAGRCADCSIICASCWLRCFIRSCRQGSGGSIQGVRFNSEPAGTTADSPASLAPE